MNNDDLTLNTDFAMAEIIETLITIKDCYYIKAKVIALGSKFNKLNAKHKKNSWFARKINIDIDDEILIPATYGVWINYKDIPSIIIDYTVPFKVLRGKYKKYIKHIENGGHYAYYDEEHTYE